MRTACNRYIVVFDSGSSNFWERRNQGEAWGRPIPHDFGDCRTACDAHAEGEAMLFRLRGMFALAICDRAAMRAFAARVLRWSKALLIPGLSVAVRFGFNWQARRSSTGGWWHAANWARMLPGAWWFRRRLQDSDDLGVFIGVEEASLALRGFDADAWTLQMSGALPRSARLAFGQMEFIIYLRKQLLRNSDWANLGHCVELGTPLVDVGLLTDLQLLKPAFQCFSNKCFLAEAPMQSLVRDKSERPKSGLGISVWRGQADLADQAGSAFESRNWAREVVPPMEAAT